MRDYCCRIVIGCNLMRCCVTVIPLHYNRLVVYGIDGNVQHATVTARRGMRPNFRLVVLPGQSTHCPGRDNVDCQTDKQHLVIYLVYV